MPNTRENLLSDAVLEEGKSILELIEYARIEAVRNGIKANSIVINRGLVKVTGDYFMFPDMICGLKSYLTSTELPEDYAFAVLHDPNREKQPGWIPVTERLPEENVRVLVCFRFTDYSQIEMDTDRIEKGKWHRWSKYVTHWMPLPEPPKGE